MRTVDQQPEPQPLGKKITPTPAPAPTPSRVTSDGKVLKDMAGRFYTVDPKNEVANVSRAVQFFIDHS